VDYDISFHFQDVTPFAPRTEGSTIEWNISDITTQPADPADSGFIWGGQGLEWRLYLKRKPGYYETYVLFPIHMIVAVIYLSFFISRYAVPARIAIVMISLLGLINLSNTVRSSMPRTDQGCWLLDVIGVAQWFVLYAAMEYGVVNMLTRAEVRIKTARHDHERRVAQARGLAVPAARSPAEIARAADEEVELHHDMVVEEQVDVMVEGEEPSNSSPKTRRESRRESFRQFRRKSINSVAQAVKRKSGGATVDDPQFRAEMGRLGRFLFEEKTGRMRVRDEHLDIVSRYCFVPAYAIAVGIMESQIQHLR